MYDNINLFLKNRDNKLHSNTKYNKFLAWNDSMKSSASNESFFLGINQWRRLAFQKVSIYTLNLICLVDTNQDQRLKNRHQRNSFLLNVQNTKI